MPCKVSRIFQIGRYAWVDLPGITCLFRIHRE
jgi:hypothetical protein